MRTSQVIGLKDSAKNFTEVIRFCTEHTIRIFDDGESDYITSRVGINVVDEEELDSDFGMFGEFNCTRYIHPNGDFFDEFVQAEPWSSGAVTFLALKDKNGKVVEETLWTDEEIEQYI